MMQQQSTLKSLQVLHKAMLVGQIIFAAIAVFLNYTDKFPPSLASQDQLLQLIAVAVSFACVFIGHAVFKKKVAQARDISGIKEKATLFRTASIIQFALLEAAAMFCIICFLLVGNYSFIALAIAIMLWFAMNAPSKMKAMLLLRMSEEEMESF